MMSSEYRETYVLNKRTLVLEGVTLAQVVELVVKVLVNLAGGTVLHQQATQDTQTAHPHDGPIHEPVSTSSPTMDLPSSSAPSCCFFWRGLNLRRHSSVRRTLPLTVATVPPDSPRGRQLTRTAPRVHGDRLLDDEAIGNQLADGLARVGVGDLVDFVRVQPDLALAAASDGRRQALLRAEGDPAEQF